MSEAIYGLVSALGGVFLGAAATVTTPALSGQYARRQAQRVRDEVAFERMMELRRVTRDVLLILDGGRRAMRRSEPVDFLRSLGEAVGKTREAAARCEKYGLRFERSRSSAEAIGVRRPPPESVALRDLVRSALATAFWIGMAVQTTGARQRMYEQWADDHYESAENARRRLLGVLWDRMDELRESMGRS
ncbi:hypothetical protein [Streptomyces sp. NPDC004250]|uniref:hypothetical protein n=1 Tax=Streptomyces sp. NPDC004250 TaxID=3364692 RepID=UPI0036976069